MYHSAISIMDLPDEMIMKIWNKLSKIDVIYSFVGVNRRFDKLVRDASYTRSIQLIKGNSTGNSCALSNRTIDRYCLNILPKIHHLIKCFTIEPFYMKRILLSGDYPHLYNKLTLPRIRQDFALEYFTDKICYSLFMIRMQ